MALVGRRTADVFSFNRGGVTYNLVKHRPVL
jgi:hypothetical protein